MLETLTVAVTEAEVRAVDLEVVAKAVAVRAVAMVAAMVEEVTVVAEQVVVTEAAAEGAAMAVGVKGEGRVEEMVVVKVVEAWEAEKAVARETDRMGAVWAAREEVGKAGVMAAVSKEDSVAAAKVAAAPSSGRRSRGAWTRMGGRLHLR